MLSERLYASLPPHSAPQILHDRLQQHLGAGPGSLDREDCELITAEPGDHIGVSECISQDLSRLDQRPVPS